MRKTIHRNLFTSLHQNPSTPHNPNQFHFPCTNTQHCIDPSTPVDELVGSGDEGTRYDVSQYYQVREGEQAEDSEGNMLRISISKPHKSIYRAHSNNTSSTTLINPTTKTQPQLHHHHHKTQKLPHTIHTNTNINTHINTGMGLTINKTTNRSRRKSGFSEQLPSMINSSVVANQSGRSPDKKLTPYQYMKQKHKVRSRKKMSNFSHFSHFYEGSDMGKQVDYESYRRWRDLNYKQHQPTNKHPSIQIPPTPKPNPKHNHNHNHNHSKPKPQTQNKTQTIQQQQIRAMFGIHHSLLKSDTDYLNAKKSVSDWTTCGRKVDAVGKKETEREGKGKGKGRKIHRVHMRNYPTIPYYRISTVADQIQQAPILAYLKTPLVFLEQTQIPEHNMLSQSPNSIYMDPKLHTNYFTNPQAPTTITPPQPLPITFLRTLFKIQSDIIIRIFDRPSQYMFYVWLFVGGCFRRVGVDGWVGIGELWLVVLVKCIRRVLVVYGRNRRKFNELTPQQIYTMLTGLPLQTIPNSPTHSTPEFTHILHHHLQKSTLCLTYSPSQNFHLLNYTTTTTTTADTKLILYNIANNTVEKVVDTLQVEDRVGRQFYFLGEVLCYVYGFGVGVGEGEGGGGVGRILVGCGSSVDIVVMGQGYIYIYQRKRQHHNNQSNQTHDSQSYSLKLRIHKKLNPCLNYTLKAGTYVILHTYQKTNLTKLFQSSPYPHSHSQPHFRSHHSHSHSHSKPKPKPHPRPPASNHPKNYISILTNNQIDIISHGEIAKRGDCVEDQDNLYVGVDASNGNDGGDGDDGSEGERAGDDVDNICQ